MYPLAAIETILPAASRKRIDYRYDYLGRRVRKTVQTWNGSAYVTSVDRKFIYDGWNLLTERDATTLSVVANYVWGLDLSKTLQDGGGVGGLLAVLEPNGTTHLTAYDGNGNVAALVNKTTGAITAAYEYDAFGQTIRATGAMSATNPFRFSTKYTDAETGLLYYGRRYYEPKLGRWLGRDPIEEKGGLHLYGFVGNNGVNRFDVLGMFDWYYTNPDGSIGHYFPEITDSPDSTIRPQWREDRVETQFGYIHRDYVTPWATQNGWRTGNLVNPFNAQQEAANAASTVETNITVSVFAAPNSGGLSALTNAKLSEGIYNENFTGVDGYTMVPGSLIDDGKTGLRTAVFSNGTNNVQVFAGTSPGSLANWWANLTQAFGFTSPQYVEGMDSAIRNYAKYEGNLSFTGHSLGGGIASASAIVTGGIATTFNPAGVHNNTIGDFSRTNGTVTSYYSTFDALRVLNSITPSSASVPGQGISLGAAGLHGMGDMVKKLGGGRPRG